MKIVEKVEIPEFPFKWINFDFLPQSNSNRKEIYSDSSDDFVSEQYILFRKLFGSIRDDIFIYHASWGDFCLETWNLNTNSYDYDLLNKSNETKNYLLMLINSQIEMSYSGSLMCRNWDMFLPIILNCIRSHKAPYGPFFYNLKNEFFFYFHHSGSIGLCYQRNNKFIDEVIKVASLEYDVR